MIFRMEPIAMAISAFFLRNLSGKTLYCFSIGSENGSKIIQEKHSFLMWFEHLHYTPFMVDEGCFSFKFRQFVNRILHVCSIKRAFVFVGTWSAFLWQRQMVWNTLCMRKTGRQIYLHITVFRIHKHRRCWRCLMQTYVPLRKTTEQERLLV